MPKQLPTSEIGHEMDSEGTSDTPDGPSDTLDGTSDAPDELKYTSPDASKTSSEKCSMVV